uniref:SH3 domain-containing protein n=1 Tax=Ditylenchus dipsaci TaxID=166011 RepID=A0A915EQW2_9BILA
MANPEGAGPRYAEEAGGTLWPQQPQGGGPPGQQQQLGADQVYGAQQQQQPYNNKAQYSGQDQQGRYPAGPAANNVENNSMAIGPNVAANRRQMTAKYDYDSRQLSPNVDAEQVELSFRQGEVITVFGEMDEDGFYIGELNGIRGLVPSNFLQPALAGTPNSLMTTAKPPGQLIPATAPVFDGSVPRPKGVAFTDTTNRKPVAAAPMRQISQGSSKSVASAQMPSGFAMATGGTGMTSKANKVIGSSAGGISATKPLTKKTSDLTSKSISASNNKKAPSAKREMAQKKSNKRARKRSKTYHRKNAAEE